MRPRVKNEISHEELDGESGNSARYTKIGTIQQVQMKESDGKIQNIPFRLKDKVIYEINLCPHCNSKNTFHNIIQQNEDMTGNVWRAEQFGGERGFDYRKFDYCLDCHKEFLIELYIWEKERPNP